jgi:hypothetical protein
MEASNTLQKLRKFLEGRVGKAIADYNMIERRRYRAGLRFRRQGFIHAALDILLAHAGSGRRSRSG